MTYEQSADDLRSLLTEQIRFMHRSARFFDEGDEGEAKRLATHIRLLVHDTARSHSLLGLMGVKETMRFEDTTLRRVELPPGSIILHSGITVTQMGSRGVRFAAPLYDIAPERVGPPVPFDRWWKPTILTDSHGHAHSRKSMTLALANQDGGAHVDPQLQRAYAALTKENALGRWGSNEFGEEHPLDNLVLASVRQVAHELDRSIAAAV